jgi:hypothetical protein
MESERDTNVPGKSVDSVKVVHPRWHRSWKTFFFRKPVCPLCADIFRDLLECETHWILKH